MSRSQTVPSPTGQLAIVAVQCCHPPRYPTGPGLECKAADFKPILTIDESFHLPIFPTSFCQIKAGRQDQTHGLEFLAHADCSAVLVGFNSFHGRFFIGIGKGMLGFSLWQRLLLV